MRNNLGQKHGQALMIAMVFLLLLLPLGIVLYKSATTAVQSAVQENQQKTAAQVASDVITDYMRAFSNDPYGGHYDAASLSRPPSGYYSNAISSVTCIANPTAHTVYLSVLGQFSPGQRQQRVQALIVFLSRLVLYGSMFNSSVSNFGVNGATYYGGFYVNGDLSIGGSNVVFQGGPVIVKGTLTGATNTVVNGNLYYSTAYSNVTVNGTAFNYIPSLTWPTFDTNYFAAQAGTTTTTSQTITFNSNGTFTFSGGPTYTIPSQGIIIYANNTNITLSGVVSGLVTVVSYASNAAQGCGATAGQINVTGNLYYAGASSITATAANSFAAMASNCINFQSSSNLLVAGAYFVQGSGSQLMELQCNPTNSCSGNTLKLYGTRAAPVYVQDNYTQGGSAIFTYDSGLRVHQPPGLPEQAYLVNFNLH